MTQQLICDFCSDTKSLTLIACKTFDVKHSVCDFPMTSVEGWWACPPCLQLIENGDRDGLFRRSKQSYIEKNGRENWDDRIDPYLYEFQRQFWENRDA